MTKQNIEIKAKYEKHNHAKKILKHKEAKKTGLDHQIDTYFKTNKGKLKVREAKVKDEKGLVYYERETKKGPKTAKVSNCNLINPGEVKKVLKNVHDVEAIVEKKREIYWLGNVKVHLDNVKDLGKFIEFELMKDKGKEYLSKKDLEKLMDEFKVKKENLLDKSYSDMIKQRD